MRISLLQYDISWADKGANLQKVGAQIASLAGATDLVVLPEMFTTGFCTDQLELAESMEGETVQQLKNWATKHQLGIVGSFIATENDKTYNRSFFVSPNGAISTADKRHLFSLGGEGNYFTAGDNPLLVNFMGFNIRVIVCYDIRFPVWSRNVNNAYDLLICVANFPKRRINDWDILLKARAIENQCYVCGVNRTGTDRAGIVYNGHSILMDAQANPILTFEEEKSCILTADLSLEQLQQHRTRFPFLQDADDFELSPLR